MKKTLLILLLLVGTSMFSFGQKVGIKTNLLYDASATINLGVEFGLGKKTTLDVSANYNGWMLNKEKKISYKHFLVMPEFRYWLCEKFSGSFFGVHVGYIDYDVSKTILADCRFDGNMFGGGISYGYQFFLGNHWNLEATIGAGYARRSYDKYVGANRDIFSHHKKDNYWGITKAGISLIYIIK